VADVVCCDFDEHFGPGGVVLHSRLHPRCSCGQRGQEVAPLRYQRSDGVNGMSQPICSDCAPEQVRRLERMGFRMVYAIAKGGGLFDWPAYEPNGRNV
jgi:hypothetical protein